MHNKRNIFKMKGFQIANVSKFKFQYAVVNFFVVIWLRYECLKSGKRFENCPKCTKMAYYVSEERNARNVTYNTRINFVTNVVSISSSCAAAI